MFELSPGQSEWLARQRGKSSRHEITMQGCFAVLRLVQGTDWKPVGLGQGEQEESVGRSGEPDWLW